MQLATPYFLSAAKTCDQWYFDSIKQFSNSKFSDYNLNFVEWNMFLYVLNGDVALNKVFF